MEDTTLLSMADHLGFVAVALEWVVVLIELFAIAILLLGIVRFTGWFSSGEVMRRDAHERDH